MPSLFTPVNRATAQRYREPQAPGAPRAGAGTGLATYFGFEPNARYTDGQWERDILPRIKNCPPVDTGTSTLVDMMASATFGVSPGHEPTREWLRRQFGFEGRASMLLDPFEATLRRLSGALFAGAGAWEFTTRVEPGDTTATPDGTIYVNRLFDLDMRLITTVYTDPDEQIVGVRYMPTPDPIRASQMLYFVFRPQGVTDFSGRGILRAIAEEAQDHAELGQFLRIGARRFATGDVQWKIDVKVARECGVNLTPEWVDAETLALADFCRSRESGEDAFVVPKPWWVETRPATSQGYDPQALVAQRFSYEEIILRQLTAEYLLVGGTSGGSYSAAEVKVTRAAAVARNLLEALLDELDRQVVRPTIARNWPTLPLDQYPRIVASGLKAKVFVQFAALLIQFAQAGIIQKTDELEDAVTAAFELPPRTRSLSPEQRAFTSPVGAMQTPLPGVETA
jgi:hypothetical protein